MNKNLCYAWALAAGDIVFYTNSDVLTSFGTLKSTQRILHNILLKKWGIADRDGLMQKMEWLRMQGDSANYRSLAQDKKEDAEKRAFFQKYHGILGNKALLAWDMGNYCCLLRWGESVGYFDFTEACKKLIQVARQLQSRYESWEEYFDHFLIGQSFNSKNVKFDPDKAKAYLLDNPRSPWQQLDWKLDLNEEFVPQTAAQASPFHVDLSGSMEEVLKKKDQYYASWMLAEPENLKLLSTYARFKRQECKDAAGAAGIYEQFLKSGKKSVEAYEQYAWLMEYEIKDAMKARVVYEMAAELGSVVAYTALGRFYAQGIGVEKNIEKALSQYQQAAAQEHPQAQFLIGLIYQTGEGVNQSFNKANEWFTRAADNGYSDAMLYMGYNYEHGQGLTQNYAQAAVWYVRAAELKNSVAMYNLGILYELGNGVAQDANQAYQHFHAAAQQGYASAIFQTGWCLHYGKGVAIDYKEAMQWYQRSVARKEPKALIHMGVLYHEGLGVEVDLEKAKSFYLQVVEQNDFARYQLGRLLFEQESYKLAWEWLEPAAKNNVAGAQRLIAYYYLNGHPPVVKSPKKALKWFERAAQKNDAIAQYELGDMYDNRIGVMTRNANKAEHWYERAADLGNADAQFAMGWYNEIGETEKPDLQQAYAWYYLADKQGDVRAHKKLEDFKNQITDEEIKFAMEIADRFRLGGKKAAALLVSQKEQKVK